MNDHAKPLIATDEVPHVTPAGWGTLRRFTDARIALGRAGHSQPTAPHLAFQLAHAQARDAVHLPFDAHGVAAGVQALGLDVVHLHSAAADRATYLQRPDLGRRLDEVSRARLQQRTAAPVDLAFVVGDGLSALAIHQNAVPLIAAMLARLQSEKTPWTLGPVAIVEQARVAVGDETGAGLHARCVVVLIGERPGLSSPDSMGLYLTWAPQPGLTDASRNCISNVRPAGLAIEAAAAKLVHLLGAARTGQISGVGLKDDHDEHAALPSGGGDPSHNFLLGH
ncbi:ethanolamine ammonia-lyase subunit EutC [Hydrogenophaga sp. MI9]|uniref:ethanolamine ammonia-lyase subunit EutC n=1 Tax=Hydrogenophaga sp. MI9 TaxID=3453719 RepID=UPI003EEFC983